MAKLQLPVSDEHFRAIGRISVHLEYLQEQMNFWIWSLIGTRQRIGQVVTAGMSFKQSGRLLGALASEQLVLPADIEQLVELLKQADKCEDRRNEILHSVWGGGGDAPWRVKTKIKARQICFDMDERLTVEQLDAIADEIESVHLALQRLLIEILRSTAKHPSVPSIGEINVDGPIPT